MNQKQLEDSIFEAVSNVIERVWTIEEKQLIQNDSELQSHLKEWLSNSLSDTCWHQANYKIVRDLSTPSNFSQPMNFFEDEEIYIPYLNSLKRLPGMCDGITAHCRRSL